LPAVFRYLESLPGKCISVIFRSGKKLCRFDRRHLHARPFKVFQTAFQETNIARVAVKLLNTGRLLPAAVTAAINCAPRALWMSISVLECRQPV